MINLLAALLETRAPLTADEVRSRVPGYPDELANFRRAFERDKDTLREMGVPIEFDEATAGYRIPKDEYYLSDPGLAPDELAALHLAASVVRVEGSDGLEALWKLGGAPADSPSEVGPAAMPAAAVPGADHLVALFSAVSERRTVSFDYRGRRRELEPHGLAFRNGHWYLAAREPGGGETRSYRLDRIASPVATGATVGAFGRADGPGAPVAPWEFGGDEPVVAELLVDADQAGWAVHHLGEQAVTRRLDDGGVVLSVPVTNRDAFVSFVLGFLDHAEVLAPDDLRHGVVTWLQGLVPG